MAKEDGVERVEITRIEDLRDWLEEHHEQPESIWLVTYKKQVADKYVARDDVVDEALCFGWIDSLPRKLDAERTMLRLSPRQPGSAWSRVNKEKVERLQREGRLRPAALRKIEQAKASGAWIFLDDVDALVAPDDVVTALAAYPDATGRFEAFPASSRRGILEWIKQAKRPETRRRRVEETARLAQNGIKANHPAGRR